MQLKRFRKMWIVAAVCVAFLSFSGSALAQPPELDFDQGIDVPKVNGFLSPISGAAQRVVISSRAMGKGVVRAPGYLFGPWQPKILNNKDYPKAQEYPPLIESLPGPVSAPLLADWKKIETTRGVLLRDAAVLEPIDQKLYRDGVALNDEADTLSKEQDDLNVEIGQYNSRCAGQPRNDFCERWRADLVRRIGVLQGKIDRHNANVAAWSTKAAELEDKGEELDEKIISWGPTIGAFILAAEQALGGLTAVDFQAQGNDMQKDKVIKIRHLGPLCVFAGQQALVDLGQMLTRSELSERDEALAIATAWVTSRPAQGGVVAPPPHFKTFQNKNRRTPNARIDIEVVRGHAFVDCPAGVK